MSASVTGLWFTPVKGTRVRAAKSLELGPGGAPEDRRFYVIDERGRMLNGKVLGELNAVVSELGDDDRLSLTFPDGRVVSEQVGIGDPVRTRFYSFSRDEHLLDGPWSEALSEFLGRPVRLVHADGVSGAVDRGVGGAVSLISRASLERLASEAAVDAVDARRFRMLIEIDGVPAHAEDGWVGRRVRIGAALVRFHGHVGRCLITSRDPETGQIDLPTLDILEGYRGGVATTEPLPFGIYGQVLEPGTVALGDPVAAAAPSRAS